MNNSVDDDVYIHSSSGLHPELHCFIKILNLFLPLFLLMFLLLQVWPFFALLANSCSDANTPVSIRDVKQITQGGGCAAWDESIKKGERVT